MELKKVKSKKIKLIKGKIKRVGKDLMTLKEAKYFSLIKALEYSNGNKYEASRILDCSVKHVYDLDKEFGLNYKINKNLKWKRV